MGGLEWKPEIGDWFYIVKDTKTGEEIEDWWLCCDVIHSDDKIILYSWNGNDITEFNYIDAIWLPFWHQCRKILKDAKWQHFQLIHNIGCNNGKISVSAERGTKVLRALGDTDLETMYQAIVLFVL